MKVIELHKAIKRAGASLKVTPEGLELVNSELCSKELIDQISQSVDGLIFYQKQLNEYAKYRSFMQSILMHDLGYKYDIGIKEFLEKNNHEAYDIYWNWFKALCHFGYKDLNTDYRPYENAVTDKYCKQIFELKESE